MAVLMRSRSVRAEMVHDNIEHVLESSEKFMQITTGGFKIHARVLTHRPLTCKSMRDFGGPCSTLNLLTSEVSL